MFFAIFRINEYTVFPAVMTFALINFVILLVIIGMEAKSLIRSAQPYISICGYSNIYLCFSSYLWDSDINLIP